MKAAVAICGTCLMLAAAPASGADCADWNTGEFFKTATAEEVTGCLQSGSDRNARDGNGSTPLHWAVYNDLDVIAALLEAGADTNARDGNGETALHHAVSHAHPDVTRALLKAGADPNAREKSGLPLLHMAMGREDNAALITALLKAGADPNARTNAATPSCMSRSGTTIPRSFPLC